MWPVTLPGVHAPTQTPKGHRPPTPFPASTDEGTPCVKFHRTRWPHGDLGNAKPHSSLFVVSDADIH